MKQEQGGLLSQTEVIELARQAECGHESMCLDWITPNNLDRFASLVEQATLENAADTVSRVPVPDGIGPYGVQLSCFDAIRNLTKDAQ